MTYGSFDTSFDSSFDVGAASEQTYPIWCDPQLLVDMFADSEPPLTLDQATAIMTEATWVLDELTNNYYHGEECWADVFEMKNGCDMILSHGPVASIAAVDQMHNCDTDKTSITGYCQYSPGRVSICPERCGGRIQNPVKHCGCPKRVRVSYSIGANLPPGAKAACLMLSTEYAKSLLGQKCNLPERINSITRQGVSWTVLDPQSFIDKGLVGISRLDSWIAIARRSVPMGRAIDPLRFGKRLFAQFLGYGACADVFIVDELPMGPATLDITGVRAGDANERQFTLLAGGQPWNLTDTTISAQARLTPTDSEIALQAEVIPVDLVNGKFLLAWDGEEVRDLLDGAETWEGVWDLQVDTADELPTTVLQGSFQAVSDVTR